jgi:transposase
MLSENRTIIEPGLYPTTDLGYREFLKRVAFYENEGYEVVAAVESTGNTRYFRNKLLQAEIGVTVVNTLKFKIVNESVKKTDKRDAKTLAEFLEKDMLPESILCTQESEDIRRVIKARSILVKAQVSIKNQVHGLLLGYGIESKRGQLQSKRERQRILSGLADHAGYGGAAVAVEPLLDTIDQLGKQVKKLEKVLEELVKEDEDVALLQTIPGIGAIGAATIRAFTDEISRFSSAKKYSAYAGLVPWVQISDKTAHYGHITKRGPIELRTAFVQAVMGMVRLQKKTEAYRIMSKYREMKNYKGSGKSIVAAARKMSTIVYAILTTREPFDPVKMAFSKKYSDMQSAAFKAGKTG